MQIPPGAFDLAPIIPAVAILTWGALRFTKSEIGRAIADRIRFGQQKPEELDQLIDEVHRLRDEMDETHERLDFAERLLASGENREPTPV